MKEIFRYQQWHLISVILFIACMKMFVVNDYDAMSGALWGVTTRTWFYIAIAIPIVHQFYVWLIWRLELFKRTFSSLLGISTSFKLYATVFSILFGSRLVSIMILAVSNRNSLLIDPYISYLIAAVITPLVIYLFYSVKKYFTIERAYGIDHFDKNYTEPYVKGGIFRFTDNGMYIYGLMILYLPGLLLFSKAALIVALFNHVYIWVHYYCTERPDMEVIYGKMPGN